MSAAPVARGHDAAPTRATCSGRAVLLPPVGWPDPRQGCPIALQPRQHKCAPKKYTWLGQDMCALLKIPWLNWSFVLAKHRSSQAGGTFQGGHNLVCSLGNLSEGDLRAKPPADGHGRGRGPPSLDARRETIRGNRPRRLGVDPGHAVGDGDPAQEQRSAVGEADLSR